MRPSTRAKTTEERTPGAKAIDFDAFSVVNKGVNQTLTDFYLTEPVRTARKAINQTDVEDRKILNAITKAFDNAVGQFLERSVTSDSLPERAVDFLSRQGYRTMLASPFRAVRESLSNLAYIAFVNPKAFLEGVKYQSEFNAEIMTNVGSAQTTRIYSQDPLTGRMVDPGAMSGHMGSEASEAQIDVLNRIQQIMNYGGSWTGSVGALADLLISTPDIAMMRPLWFGTFATTFKNQTGQDVNFDAIAKNDEAYMSEFSEAIEASKREADRETAQAGATKNPFMGIKKGLGQPSPNATVQMLKQFNGFMLNFMLYEFNASRTAIRALVNNGSISRMQGARLFAGVIARMSTYVYLAPVMSNLLLGLFGLEEEEDEEPEQLMMKSLLSAFTTLGAGSMGQLGRIPFNAGVEYVNEEYLGFLRNGEYDAYDDALQYNSLAGGDYSNVIATIAGPLSPFVKTAGLVYKVSTREESKSPSLETMERHRREAEQRIPLEILGNLGLIPFYRDARKVLNRDIYKSLDQAKKSDEAPKKKSRKSRGREKATRETSGYR